MAHIRRFAVGTMFIFATFVLGIIIDSVATPILDINYQFGVDEGPFGAVIGHIEGAMGILVPMLLVGIVLWLVWGSIREERQEEVRRRVR